jgi:hypothetical protein
MSKDFKSRHTACGAASLVPGGARNPGSPLLRTTTPTANHHYLLQRLLMRLLPTTIPAFYYYYLPISIITYLTK